MIGFDIGNTTDQKSRKVPAPSTVAASMISRGMFSKNRFTMITLNALAPAGSQTAQYDVQQRVPTIGRWSTVRNSGTSSTTGGTNSVTAPDGDERCRTAAGGCRARSRR